MELTKLAKKMNLSCKTHTVMEEDIKNVLCTLQKLRSFQQSQVSLPFLKIKLHEPGTTNIWEAVCS